MPFEKGDLLNKSDVERVFETHSPIAVMHLQPLARLVRACKRSVAECVLDHWLIQAAVDNGCMDFVFSSTCATYGDQDGVVLDEDSMQYPVKPMAPQNEQLKIFWPTIRRITGLTTKFFGSSR